MDDLHELAKVYAASYASPHHIIFTLDGLESLVAAISQPAAAINAELRIALQHLFNSYKSLADSGDAGNWRLEEQPEGIRALAALSKATP